MKFARVWHPYWAWEEYSAGMWRRIHGIERDQFLQQAIVFTGDTNLYGSWMIKVIAAWPISCEHNLTDYGMNRRAWIGHAACCLAINCPEDITRSAWKCLTEEQRIKANIKADEAIYAWQRKYAAENSRICRGLDEQRISERDSGRSRSGIGETQQGSLF